MTDAARPPHAPDGVPSRVVIWSGEHNAWWRPEARGYTTDISKAGTWPREAALRMTAHCGPEKMLRLEGYGHDEGSTRQLPTPPLPDAEREALRDILAEVIMEDHKDTMDFITDLERRGYTIMASARLAATLAALADMTTQRDAAEARAEQAFRAGRDAAAEWHNERASVASRDADFFDETDEYDDANRCRREQGFHRMCEAVLRAEQPK